MPPYAHPCRPPNGRRYPVTLLSCRVSQGPESFIEARKDPICTVHDTELLDMNAALESQLRPLPALPTTVGLGSAQMKSCKRPSFLRDKLDSQETTLVSSVNLTSTESLCSHDDCEDFLRVCVRMFFLTITLCQNGMRVNTGHTQIPHWRTIDTT